MQQYDFNNPGWNTATGHFTALVWRSTAKLGCAINAACSWPTYVCQYQAPGNVIGLDWSQQVKPAVATPSSPSPAVKPSPAVPSPSPLKPPAASPKPVDAVKASPAPAIRSSPAPAVKASPAPAVKASPAPAVAAPKTADMQKVLEIHNARRRTHQVGRGRHAFMQCPVDCWHIGKESFACQLRLAAPWLAASTAHTVLQLPMLRSFICVCTCVHAGACPGVG